MAAESANTLSAAPKFQVWVTDPKLRPVNGNSTQDKGDGKEKAPGVLVSMAPSTDYKPSEDTARAVAPIRSQYIVPAATLSAAGPSPAEADDAAERKRYRDEETGEATEELQAKAPRKGGQNKRRREQMNRHRGENGPSICKYIVMGQTCNSGDKCSFGHDLAEYLAQKPADLGDQCIHYEQFGRCPYRVACRFHKTHTEVDGSQKTDETKMAANPNGTNSVNKFTYDCMVAIRKRTYQTPKAEHFTKVLRAEMKQNRDKNTRDEQIKAKAQAQAQEQVSDEVKPDTHATPEPAKETATAATQEPQEADPTTDVSALVRLTSREKKRIDFRDKTYLAPLTTVGNLPFRRVCKSFGVDVTCGEMAVGLNMLKGQKPEWVHMKRHNSENLFGVQVCGYNPDIMARCGEMIQNECQVDFVDLNLGCPIDAIYKSGAGSALLLNSNKLRRIIHGLDYTLECPITVKFRTGVYDGQNVAHKLIPKFESWGCQLATLHGRSRQQRYTRLADWDYIGECVKTAETMPVFGNGDIMSWTDYYDKKEVTGVAGLMVGRGALIKPWIFEEIQTRRHWDISSRERFDILRQFSNYG
ncbi:tRNA-dihydrouridine(47) synthase [NAD(P)(+)]-like protein, partial [Dimargaris verticillata]